MSHTPSASFPLVSRSLSTQDIQVVCQPLVKRITHSEAVYTHLGQDSRKVSSSGVFIAVRGTKVDGHTFISALAHIPNLLIIGEESPESLSLIHI